MRPTAVCLLLAAVALCACAGSPPPPPAPPAVAVVLPPPAPPRPPSEPEGLATVPSPPRVCELTRRLDRGAVDLAVLPKVDVFGRVGAGVLTLGFAELGAFAEVRSPGWTLRGVPAEEATRVSAARWIAFGGVLYASKRDRFAVAGTRNGKLLLAAPGVAGFTPAEGAATRETACEEVSLLVDPDGALARDVPAAFLPAKAAQVVVLRRRAPVPVAADVDGTPGGTIDADDTDLGVTLLERRGKRARIRLGHVAGWVDGALVVPAPPPPSAAARKRQEAMASFGMIGLLSERVERQASLTRGQAEGPGGRPAAPAPSGAADPGGAGGGAVVCASDVRLVVDWTSTGSIAASAGVTPAARRYVVGLIPAGQPVHVVDRGPELSAVTLGESVLLPRGYARLTVPSRDLASGCAPAPSPPEPAAAVASTVGDEANGPDAIDLLASGPHSPLADHSGMFGEPIGDAFGAGGLGVSGSGQSDPGETIGLGTIGTGTRFGGGLRTTPSLREGSIKVEGRLPPEVVRRIVRQNFGRFRLCYEAALKLNPALAGRVSTRVAIDRSGAVIAVSDAGSDLPSASTVSCVEKAFSNLSFPQPEGGMVTVVYPITFSPR